jgi:hypothetical protein
LERKLSRFAAVAPDLKELTAFERVAGCLRSAICSTDSDLAFVGAIAL